MVRELNIKTTAPKDKRRTEYVVQKKNEDSDRISEMKDKKMRKRLDKKNIPVLNRPLGVGGLPYEY